MRALLLVLLLALADSQPFRGGSLTWTRSGDRSARFVFSGAFQRSYGPFHGSAPDGKPAVGDKVVISGREPILFQDGMQGSGEQVTITVSHIDLRADAFHGTFITERSFPAQQASLGVPYLARVEGCCRVSAGSLGGSFALRAAVDFTWEVCHNL
ncbi:hypothetical protein T484DRAFT_1763523 [Baffinella frigidus]|nr:hypothetical protein T484DRAFT_1763523 [Cryptophyta sp. CCMP2293]